MAPPAFKADIRRRYGQQPPAPPAGATEASADERSRGQRFRDGMRTAVLATGAVVGATGAIGCVVTAAAATVDAIDTFFSSADSGSKALRLSMDSLLIAATSVILPPAAGTAFECTDSLERHLSATGRRVGGDSFS